jgi:multidrug resistance efflux pump
MNILEDIRNNPASSLVVLLTSIVELGVLGFIIWGIYENYSLTFSGYIRTKIRNITDKVITL